MVYAVASAAIRDRDIVELLRAGHRDQALEELLQRYEAKIYRLCCAMLRDRAQAEDAAQESVVRVWKALHTFDGRSSLSSWIYTITRNRCLTALGKRRPLESMSDSDLEVHIDSIAATADERVDDQAERLRALVDRLPEPLRRVLVLYYFEDRSVGEVADMLGCPPGTVKTHLFRARAALSEEFKQRGLHDPDLWRGSAS
jgi:RNA polymerase sigma-70 factor (ECF subfamily)